MDINRYYDELKQLADKVWENPEPGFREFISSRLHQDFLKEHGFNVIDDIADTGTGYIASYGHGHPVIALLGEFDALYGLGQKADVAEYAPDGKDMGHGCGHHLLGVGNIGAGLYIKDYLEETGREGTVIVMGCPAEESGSGKAYMARDHVFDDVDIALAWHPDTINMVRTGSSQSCIQFYFRFHGVASHAAGAPEQGRSALDAVELTDIGVNYLREHMESSDRVHYAITNSGGLSPNVVQAEAEVKYLVRSTNNRKCKKLYKRVLNIARGAALMTETELEIIFDEGLSNTLPNFALEDVLKDAFRESGVPEYTEEEIEYARAFRETWKSDFTIDDIPSTMKDKKDILKAMNGHPVCTFIGENEHSEVCRMGSTDVGDVSWVVPTATISVACYSLGAEGHSWQWVAQGRSSIAAKGMMKAAEVLARGAVRLYEDPGLIVKAKDEFNERTEGEKYDCLIPKRVKPHVI